MPLWFWWTGQEERRPRLYFITSAPTQKARNLAAQPQVVVHLGDGDDVVIVDGVAGLVTDQRELDEVDRAWRTKYVDPHSGAVASVFDNPEDSVYLVAVARVRAWEYGVVGTLTEWRFG